MLDPVYAAALIFLSSWALTPIVISVSRKLTILDIPDNRKIHTSPTPRGGGFSFAAVWLTASMLLLQFGVGDAVDRRLLLALMIGGAIIFLAGLIDDIREFSSKTKLLFEILAGIAFLLISAPALPWSYPWLVVALIWIVGVTNAFNLIDGLDGLAAGLGVGAATGFALLAALVLGNQTLYLIALFLLASTSGFLPFNWHPAKIFMGDSGSLFLGFTLASIGVLTAAANPGPSGLLAPVLFVLVPLFDTILSIARRIIHRRPLFAPDKSHFYNLLMNRGFSHVGSVLLCYVLAAAGVAAGLMIALGLKTVGLAIVAIAVMFAALLILIYRYKLLAMD